MIITLPFLTISYIIAFLFYVVTTILFATKNKWYMSKLETLNPMVYAENYSYKKGLAIMIFATLLIGTTSIGLIFFLSQWWPLIICFLASANEAYRGAIYYMRAGSYKESVKHMLVHGAVCGYIISWVFFTFVPGLLTAFLLVFLF